jgi:hypothetical protein
LAEVDLGVPVDVTDRASTERLAEDVLGRWRPRCDGSGAARRQHG